MLALEIINLLATIALAIMLLYDIAVTRETHEKDVREINAALDAITEHWGHEINIQRTMADVLKLIADHLTGHTSKEGETEEESDDES